MNSTDINELEEHYLQKKLEGMDYSEIRKELAIRGMSKEDISILIRSIDNKVLSGIKVKEEKANLNTATITGIFLLGGGLLISLGTYSGWINMGNYYIVAYGPILSGAGLLLAGRRKRSGMFDRKRKF